MANKTWAGSDGAAWETNGNWSPSGKPGSSDKAIIPTAATSSPAGPVGAETIHDLEATGGAPAQVWSNLTVSNNITLASGFTAAIAAQTNSAGAIIIPSGTGLIVVGNVAGTVNVASGTVGAAQFNGAVTATGGSVPTGQVNSSLTVTTAVPLTPTSAVVWGASSSVTFLGTYLAVLTSNVSSLNGPKTVHCTPPLIIVPNDGGGDFDLTTAVITCGASCTVLYELTGQGGVDVTGGSITGPSTAGAFYTDYGTVGTPPTVTGFEPLYKVGSGSNLSNYGGAGVINLPPPSSVVRGTTFGTQEHQVDGTAAAAGGAIVYWPPQPSRPESPKPNLSRAISNR